MSKAFTKENDASDLDDDGLESGASPLPGGKKNYITPAGAERLKAELARLLNVERPEVTRTVSWAAGNGDRSENGDYIYGKKRLREIDRRIRFLTKRLEIAEIIDPARVRAEDVRFGATVTIADEEGRKRSYTIVGVDEVDVPAGRISWISPLATALLGSREGDVVSFRSPKGVEELEVLAVRYG